jgi:hypothetical protein
MQNRVKVKAPSSVVAVCLLALTMVLTFGPLTSDTGASTPSVLAHAKTQLLKLSDLPAGWTVAGNSKSASASSTDPLESAKVASCIGVSKSILDAKHRSVSSSNFTDSPTDNLEVSDSIDVFSTAELVRQHFAAIERAKTLGCVQTAFESTGKTDLEKAFAPALVSLFRVRKDGTANFAPGAYPISIDFVVSEQGQSLSVSLTIALFAKGTEEQKLGFVAVGGAFPAALSKTLTAVALKRL